MRNAGFTLLELMVVVAISIILITIAIPGMYSFIIGSQRSSSAMDFYTDLTLARSEAISRNQRVTVCKSADGTTCLALGAGSWENGWLIYVNKDDTVDATEPDYDTVDPTKDEAVVRFSDGMPTGISLNSEAADDLRRSVSFLSSGRAITSGAFLLCTSASGIVDRRIAIQPSGRIEIQEQDCP